MERRAMGGAGWLRAVVLAAALGATVSGCKPAQTSVPEVRPVRVAPVKLEPAEDVVRYAAVIRPRVEADVGFRIGGKVVQRLAEVGARVEAGQPLARLDPADIELQVRAAQAQLASARADAENARADFQRYSRLRQGEWTTRQEYDHRKTALDKAEAGVREAEAQLRVLTNSVQYTTLVADAPGIVTAVLVEPGQVVAQGQPALRLARLGEVEAVANIPEHQVGSLGQRALSVEVWSLPGASLAGGLREVAPSADPGTRTYQARVTLADPPPTVQLGMTATLVSRQTLGGSVARLPMTALTQRGTDPAVWVVAGEGDSLELRPIRVAAYVGDLAIVAAGLNDGERVVAAGVHKLDAGQKVRVWSEPAR